MMPIPPSITIDMIELKGTMVIESTTKTFSTKNFDQIDTSFSVSL
jgi:hypothetical protein